MSDISKNLLPKAESRKPKATFKFTYTRCTTHGRILEHIAETISGHTVKSVKHALVKRFGLQNWSPWRKIDTGFVKTRNAHDERGKIILEL